MHELAIYGVPVQWKRRQVDIPKPGPDEVLIKVVATGLNPKDWKFVKRRDESGALNAGDDIAGVVESVGSNVYEYKAGDRVAAFHRMGHPAGAYAEYAIAPATTTFPLPPNISFEAGAGLPLSSMTAAIALYQALGLPLPTTAGKKDIPLLVYGGATAVGAYALQLAKLSGVGPIITVAGSGIDFVKSLNAADHIIDYRKGNVTQAILAALDGKPLHHALDAVSSNRSHRPISEVLSASGGGEINMLDPPEDEDGWTFPKSVKYSRTLVASAYYQKHADISQRQAEADGEFAFWFYRYISHLLAKGSFKPHPHAVLPGGLDGIAGGVQSLYDGKVSAKKLVAR
ncbi:chaperonin 10-like protein [Cercophora newfieldiana]|uniref:Chaperonin 10-like protein n=1 Tax=Cercophora newfieldiana TaxID=92897 RepID=A0AA39Y914_9PEZI|nr:chaperonin 10-like protein [Cercophora newfieldiana]